MTGKGTAGPFMDVNVLDSTSVTSPAYGVREGDRAATPTYGHAYALARRRTCRGWDFHVFNPCGSTMTSS